MEADEEGAFGVDVTPRGLPSEPVEVVPFEEQVWRWGGGQGAPFLLFLSLPSLFPLLHPFLPPSCLSLSNKLSALFYRLNVHLLLSLKFV